jgi:hypothetical protein
MKYARQVMSLKVTLAPHFSNPVASTIPKWQRYKLLRWVQRNPLIISELSMDLNDILYGGDGIEDDIHAILYNPAAWRRYIKSGYIM